MIKSKASERLTKLVREELLKKKQVTVSACAAADEALMLAVGRILNEMQAEIDELAAKLRSR